MIVSIILSVHLVMDFSTNYFFEVFYLLLNFVCLFKLQRSLSLILILLVVM